MCKGELLAFEGFVICKHNNDAVIHSAFRKSPKIQAKFVDKHIELTIVAPQSNDSKERNFGVRKRRYGLEIEYHDSVPKEDANENILLETVIDNPKAALPAVSLDQIKWCLDLIKSTYDGLMKWNHPKISLEGVGGTYLMMDASGTKCISVFKPTDEEPNAVNNPKGKWSHLLADGEGLKKGTTVGEGALMEVAAYILDHPKGEGRSFFGEHNGFSGVPPTFMATCSHEGFNHPDGVKEKIGSLQMFIENVGSCEDMGSGNFPVEEVHNISVLDIRMANADRHAGNILTSKGEYGKFVLTPIDHGYCLPTSFEDCTFFWLNWPQAHQSFSPKTVIHIRSLDAEEDIVLLKFYGCNLPSECERTLRISTMLLKKGVERGLTPFAIGNIMCRENLKEQSEIEKIVKEALPLAAKIVKEAFPVAVKIVEEIVAAKIAKEALPMAAKLFKEAHPEAAKIVKEALLEAARIELLKAAKIVEEALPEAAFMEAISLIMDQHLNLPNRRS